MLQLARSASLPGDLSNLGFAHLKKKVFCRFVSSEFDPLGSDPRLSLRFKNIYASLKKASSRGVSLLLRSSLIIPLPSANVAGRPGAGAWPVVRADGPWRVLGAVVGLEKYSFDIFNRGNTIPPTPFFFSRHI